MISTSWHIIGMHQVPLKIAGSGELPDPDWGCKLFFFWFPSTVVFSDRERKYFIAYHGHMTSFS